MKVVYRSIIKELDEAVNTAAEHGRKIERFELTPSEWRELQREMALYFQPPLGSVAEPATYAGIPIVKQNNKG